MVNSSKSEVAISNWSNYAKLTVQRREFLLLLPLTFKAYRVVSSTADTAWPASHLVSAQRVEEGGHSGGRTRIAVNGRWEVEQLGLRILVDDEIPAEP